MIVQWEDRRTGPHTVDTQTAPFKELHAARRAFNELADFYCVARMATYKVPSVDAPLEAINAAIKVRKKAA
jgi:hypothetical protein